MITNPWQAGEAGQATIYGARKLDVGNAINQQGNFSSSMLPFSHISLMLNSLDEE